MSSDRPRTRRSSDELDQLAIRAARLVYEDRLSHSEVAQQLAMAPEFVANLIRRARASSLIRLRVEPLRSSLSVLGDLSSELARAASLPHTVVVRVPSLDEEARDATQLALGEATANFLSLYIRPHDNIGIGGGKSVNYVMRQLATNESGPKYSGQQILSLSGGAVRGLSGNETRMADADSNTEMLAQALGASGDDWRSIRFVHLPLFVGEGHSDIVRSVAPHLLEPTNTSVPPLRLDLALLTCQVVDPDHHIFYLSHTPDPIVECLIQLQTGVWPHAPAAIIDIGNNYCVGEVPNELRKTTEQIAKGLNTYAVAAAPAIIGRTRERILVIGGPSASRALLPALTNQIELRPTTLVTDERTAVEVLDRLAQARS